MCVFVCVCVCPVTRRCFPALAGKEGSITVGNSSRFDDGAGTIREAKDLVDGVKYVDHHMDPHHTIQDPHTVQDPNATQS